MEAAAEPSAAQEVEREATRLEREQREETQTSAETSAESSQVVMSLQQRGTLGSAGVFVRPWTLADVPAVSALLGDVLRPLTLTHASVARHSRKRLEKELPRDAETLSACPGDAEWQMFVAVADEEGGSGSEVSSYIVGCIGLRMSGGCATLDRLAVVETWRRRGVARALVEVAQAQAVQQHGTQSEAPASSAPLRLFATTVDAEARAAAVSFWGQMGYSEVGPRRQIGKKGAPLALVSFEKHLQCTCMS